MRGEILGVGHCAVVAAGGQAVQVQLTQALVPGGQAEDRWVGGWGWGGRRFQGWGGGWEGWGGSKGGVVVVVGLGSRGALVVVGVRFRFSYQEGGGVEGCSRVETCSGCRCSCKGGPKGGSVT